MADELRLSVVLATYNRAETLRETLRHLAAQTLDPSSFEVIVVDDGSPDHTRQVVKEFRTSAPFEMSYLHHENHGPGYTQNQGLRVARAPIVLLMADDIFMAPATLQAHLDAHDVHPETTAAILGRVVQSPRLNQSVFLRTWDSFRFSDFTGLQELPYYRFWACNISIKRDFVLQQGLFREHRGRAGAAAHEDPELGYRLHQAGLRIYLRGEALGHHYHVVTLEEACVRNYQQGLNFDEFRALAPAPEIPVAYHVIRWKTLPDYWRTWSGPGRRHLSASDRNPIVLMGRCAIRALAFNGLTVRCLWRPLMERAEHDPWIARRMRSAFYRGVLSHYFFRGCRDGNRRFGLPQAHRAQVGGGR